MRSLRASRCEQLQDTIIIQSNVWFPRIAARAILRQAVWQSNHNLPHRGMSNIMTLLPARAKHNLSATHHDQLPEQASSQAQYTATYLSANSGWNRTAEHWQDEPQQEQDQRHNDDAIAPVGSNLGGHHHHRN